jgi:hypothetical protein
MIIETSRNDDCENEEKKRKFGLIHTATCYFLHEGNVGKM